MKTPRKSVRIVAAALAALQAPALMAMPKSATHYPGMNSFQAYAIAHDNRLKSVNILHDDTVNTLYVSPSSKTAEFSGFQTTGTFACDVLENQWRLTFAFPNISDSAGLTDIANQGAFSPYFDSQVGLPIHSQGLIRSIADKIATIEALKSAHPDIVSAYSTTKEAYTQATNNVATSQASVDNLNGSLQSAVTLLGTARTADAQKSAREALDAARAQFDSTIPDLLSTLATQKQTAAKAGLEYAQAKGAYDSAFPNVPDLQVEVKALSSIYSDLITTASSAFGSSNELLQSIENTPVGVAQGSYQIWGDEESALREAVSSNTNSFYSYFLGGSTSVARLPIFDVRSTSAVVPERFQAAVVPPGMANVSAASSRTLGTGDVVGGDSAAVNTVTSSFRSGPSNNAPLIGFKTTTVSDGGSGVVGAVITRGALCQASTPSQRILDVSAYNRTYHMTVPQFVPRQENVLYQSVAFNYKYQVRTDPTSVRCDLDADKLVSYVSSAGSDTFLLWSTHWSSEELDKAASYGLVCKVKNSGGDAGMSTDQLNAMQQKMTMELVADFALQLGDGVAVNTMMATAPASGGNAYAEMGEAAQSVCGINVYCQIGAIALKNLNKLVNFSSGSSNSTTHVTGHFYRDYSLENYTVLPGTAVTQVKVAL